MSNIAHKLERATRQLEESGVAEARREANSLLAFALGRDRTFLITHPEYELTPQENQRFEGFLMMRVRRVPFQYITGRQEFYGLEFFVTPDVLIPRPETEIIVEQAVGVLKTVENPTFCEIGVGSGCLSTAILYEIRTAQSVGADISEKALQIAQKNAERHGVAERLELKISDVFENLPREKFALIVSNPPYIPQADFDALQAEVRDFEPKSALTDGHDGLSIIKKIIRSAPDFLKPEGFLLIEIGIHQAPAVFKMLAREIWTEIEFLRDLQGIERTLKAKKKMKENKVFNG